MTAYPAYASFLGRLTEGRTLPAGCNTWGVKTVRPDGRTYNGYQWPLTPGLVTATNPDPTNTRACPSRDGDGLCVASNHCGMASGGIPARTLLLLAYHTRHLLSVDNAAGKCRVSKVRVVDVIDGERAVREHGRGANLSDANLRGANLSDANLSRANLFRADLRGANLSGANLSGADLRVAILSGANLSGANLSGANLSGANLSGADLRVAILSDANLSRADLRVANLSDANLSRANLFRADLRGANLRGANHDEHTRWPVGWDASRVAEAAQQ